MLSLRTRGRSIVPQHHSPSGWSVPLPTVLRVLAIDAHCYTGWRSKLLGSGCAAECSAPSFTAFGCALNQTRLEDEVLKVCQSHGVGSTSCFCLTTCLNCAVIARATCGRTQSQMHDFSGWRRQQRSAACYGIMRRLLFLDVRGKLVRCSEFASAPFRMGKPAWECCCANT